MTKWKYKNNNCYVIIVDDMLGLEQFYPFNNKYKIVFTNYKLACEFIEMQNIRLISKWIDFRVESLGYKLKYNSRFFHISKNIISCKKKNIFIKSDNITKVWEEIKKIKKENE